MSIETVTEKLRTRMNDIRKFNKKYGDYSGEDFANGLDFAIQELEEYSSLSKEVKNGSERGEGTYNDTEYDPERGKYR